MGVLLGGFIDADPDVLEGATSYFDFVVPGLIAAHAMQTAVGETTYPVMGMIKWQRIYDSMLATPLGVPRPGGGAPVVRAVPAGHDLRGLRPGAGAVRRLRQLVGADRWRSPSQLLVGMTFAVWVYGFSARLTLRGGVRRAVPARGLPALPVQRRVLPDQQPRHRRRVDRPVHAAVARRQPVPDVRPRQRHLVGGRGQRRRTSSVLTVAGWFWAVSGLEKRLVS